MYNYAGAFCILGQLAVVYAPFFQDIFQTEALSVMDLVFLVCLSSSVLWADEARKWREQKMSYGGAGAMMMGGKSVNTSDVEDDRAALLV